MGILYRKNINRFFQPVGRGIDLLSQLPPRAPAPLLPCPPAPQAFTLMEVLVTLIIIGMMGMVASIIFTTSEGDAAFDHSYQATVEIMDQIQKAILGENIPFNRGVQINGYVANIGALPVLNDNGQPEGLWKRPKGIASARYHPGVRIKTGWDGPYVAVPDTGFLSDGWGTALSFEIGPDKSMTITSFGGDKKLGGSGPAEDIVIKIEPHQYMAPLGFSFRGVRGDLDYGASKFIINYPDPETGSVASQELMMDRYTSDKLVFGLYISDGEDRPLYPIGLRSMTASIKHGDEEQETVVVFPVQPGMNYLGTIE